MDDDKFDLMFEILKKLQSDNVDIKGSIRELKDGQIRIMDSIHGLRGDILRHDKALASIEVDLDRIKARLDLTD